ncbi:MAG: hypothetical protein HYS77_14745 [Candidatus Rokubacteria bacterium]|nr:hypothetical protein [Candidatus Rokubacteria bacterium]
MSFRALFLAALVLGLPGCVRHPESCWVCQREVHASVRTNLILASGKKVVACCPRCALHYQEEPGKAVREIRVTDHAGGGSLPLDAAFLIEGSDETPCMRHHPVADESHTPMQVCYDRCMPSLIAFKEEAAARAFAADHGGTIHRPGTVAPPRSASP